MPSMVNILCRVMSKAVYVALLGQLSCTRRNTVHPRDPKFMQCPEKNGKIRV